LQSQWLCQQWQKIAITIREIGANTMSATTEVGTKAEKPDGMAEICLRDRRRNIAIMTVIAGPASIEIITIAQLMFATADQW
jgi:hypothetical protein